VPRFLFLSAHFPWKAARVLLLASRFLFLPADFPGIPPREWEGVRHHFKNKLENEPDPAWLTQSARRRHLR
jgi:hypothetical protein